MMTFDRREAAIRSRIARAGLPDPTAVTFGQGGTSVAVAFTVNMVTETVEGCGASDDALADDVIRQAGLLKWLGSGTA